MIAQPITLVIRELRDSAPVQKFADQVFNEAVVPYETELFQQPAIRRIATCRVQISIWIET